MRTRHARAKSLPPITSDSFIPQSTAARTIFFCRIGPKSAIRPNRLGELWKIRGFG
jgi:hypothetical protein